MVAQEETEEETVVGETTDDDATDTTDTTDTTETTETTDTTDTTEEIVETTAEVLFYMPLSVDTYGAPPSSGNISDYILLEEEEEYYIKNGNHVYVLAINNYTDQDLNFTLTYFTTTYSWSALLSSSILFVAATLSF
mmetsp:Transcript_18926/g.18070  ORF Transcript_18926/g.18070 Transcript_18926/m.18070 type:complete len:137 (+) Transcript_18926:359-769(+)